MNQIDPVSKTPGIVEASSDAATFDVTHDGDPFRLIIKSSRYLSDWNDNVVKLDLRKEGSTKPLSPFIIDLNKITVNLEEGTNVQRGILPLASFADFLPAIKLAIHSRLVTTESGVPQNDVTSTIWTCQRVVTYMLRNSIYKLSSVSRETIAALLKSVYERGWFETLNVEAAIDRFIAKVTLDPSLGQPLLGKGHAAHQTINPEALAIALGIYIPRDRIPTSLRQRLIDLSSKRKRQKAPYTRQPRVDGGSYTVARVLVVTLNGLSQLPTGVDSIPFRPFHEPSKALEPPSAKFGGNNFPIEDAVKLFAESLKWIYDYRNITLDIFNRARLASAGTDSMPGKADKLQFEQLLLPLQRDLAEAGVTGFEKHSDVYVLLNDLQKLVFSSCAAVIACNHGRRMGEIVGTNLNYGLYFGCIQQKEESSEDFRIDLYIQKKKNSRAWFRFWCNELVRDATSFLEEIANELREIDAPPLEKLSDELDARTQRLFRMRSFPENFDRAPTAAFEWGLHCKWFLEKSEVALENFRGGPPPFRRFFISLYIHRFEFNELIPLHRHIRHTTLATLVGYGKDSVAKKNEQSIATTMKSEPAITADVAKLLQGASFEYLKSYVLRLLQGEAIGGGFARIVHEFAKAFFLSDEFVDQSPQEQAKVITIKLNEAGYVAHEKATGPCTGSNDVATATLSKCFREGAIHPEDASPTLCCGCIHSSTSPAIRRRYAIELERADKESRNFKLPGVLRKAAAKAKAQMTRIIAAENRMAVRNPRYFQVLTRRDI
jgi:hypothetical protein